VKSGIDREYGRDSQGRRLHELTVHSARHNAEILIMPSKSVHLYGGPVSLTLSSA
jgi:hypothetical protein